MFQIDRDRVFSENCPAIKMALVVRSAFDFYENYLQKYEGDLHKLDFDETK